MPDTMMRLAAEVLESSRRVRAHQMAVQEAQRLRERVKELRPPLTDVGTAIRQWQVYRGVGVELDGLPPLEPLAVALVHLRSALGADSAPPDEAFVALRNAVTGLRNQLRQRLEAAWRRYATNRTSAAGLASAHLLPPVTRQALAGVLEKIDTATETAPTTETGIRAFHLLVDSAARQVEQSRVRDLPTQLNALLRRVNDGGLPLGELTEEDLGALKEHGFDRHLTIRWASA